MTRGYAPPDFANEGDPYDLKRRISEVTRRDLGDYISLNGIVWSGRLSESDFLARIYDLSALPSTDYRHSDAAGDIAQHRERWRDWDDNWVFLDERFGWMRGPDEVVIRFLCEMLHPLVVRDQEDVDELLAELNRLLAPDGWELYPNKWISGRAIYAGRSLLVSAPVAPAQDVGNRLDSDYLRRQVRRLNDALEQSDIELAIGTAKDFVESVCKAILRQQGVAFTRDDALPALMKRVSQSIELAPGGPDASRTRETTRILLNNLTQIVQRISELRNLHGAGHGKDPHVNEGVELRHARLVAGAAAALAQFLVESAVPTVSTASLAPQVPEVGSPITDDDLGDLPF